MSESYLKRRTHEILEGTREEPDRTSQTVQWFIIVLIVLNVAAVIMATVQSINRNYGGFFRAFELFSVAVFTAEYVLRVWSATEYSRYSHPVWGRLRFMGTPGAVIDLLAILPVFLPLLPNFDLRGLRALRLFRLLRLLKLGRFSRSITVFFDVMVKKWDQIAIAGLTVSIMLVFSSSLIYFAERSAQPLHFSSIPQSMWWGVITLTTVGYGNIYPVTLVGKILGAGICFLGIGIFAIPAGILASGFQEALEKKYGAEEDDEDEDDEESEETDNSDRAPDLSEHNYCPCCGNPLGEKRDPNDKHAAGNDR
jgi:voltage-gated potassium channel